MNAAADRYGISEASWVHILRVLRSHPEVRRVVIFGSRAMGTARHGSDIDLAISGPDVDEANASDIWRELNERAPIPYSVDVVVLDKLDHPELRDHIATHGRELYRRDPDESS